MFRYRDAVSPAVFLTLLVMTRPVRLLDSDGWDRALDGVGLLLASAGQALRVAVIGYAYIVRGGRGRRVHADDLVTSGLFAASRNPLYVGNLLVYAGLLIVWNSPLMYVVAVPFFLFLYRSIVAAEEAFLHVRFGAAYERYCRDVGRWIPDFRRLPESLEGMSFNWRRVVLKDYGSIAAWTLTACLLLILETLHFHGYASSERSTWALVGLMGSITAMWALARWLKLTRRLRE